VGTAGEWKRSISIQPVAGKFFSVRAVVLGTVLVLIFVIAGCAYSVANSRAEFGAATRV
jgi:hypothetical protein